MVVLGKYNDTNISKDSPNQLILRVNVPIKSQTTWTLQKREFQRERLCPNQPIKGNISDMSLHFCSRDMTLASKYTNKPPTLGSDSMLTSLVTTTYPSYKLS